MNSTATTGSTERSVNDLPRRVVVIGASAGGLRAIQTLLGGLESDFPWPVVIVQHRARESDSGLCGFLQRSSRLRVSEPEDKEAIRTGRAYLAPRDYHLLVEAGHFALSTEAPLWHARPSIDVLFESAADSCGAGAIGVILTGANADGAAGLARIKASGGVAVVQDPATAESSEMPESAIAATVVDRVLPLPAISSYLADLSRDFARI